VHKLGFFRLVARTHLGARLTLPLSVPPSQVCASSVMLGSLACWWGGVVVRSPCLQRYLMEYEARQVAKLLGGEDKLQFGKPSLKYPMLAVRRPKVPGSSTGAGAGSSSGGGPSGPSGPGTSGGLGGGGVPSSLPSEGEAHRRLLCLLACFVAVLLPVPLAGLARCPLPCSCRTRIVSPLSLSPSPSLPAPSLSPPPTHCSLFSPGYMYGATGSRSRRLGDLSASLDGLNSVASVCSSILHGHVRTLLGAYPVTVKGVPVVLPSVASAGSSLSVDAASAAPGEASANADVALRTTRPCGPPPGRIPWPFRQDLNPSHAGDVGRALASGRKHVPGVTPSVPLLALLTAEAEVLQADKDAAAASAAAAATAASAASAASAAAAAAAAAAVASVASASIAGAPVPVIAALAEAPALLAAASGLVSATDAGGSDVPAVDDSVGADGVPGSGAQHVMEPSWHYALPFSLPINPRVTVACVGPWLDPSAPPPPQAGAGSGGAAAAVAACVAPHPRRLTFVGTEKV
jgi:hypothetical protein